MGMPDPHIQFSINLAEASRGIMNNIDRGLLRTGKAILEQAEERTPKDTGALRASKIAFMDPRQPHTAIIGYTAPYAAAVHERVEVPHDPGEAKWLQNTFDEMSPMLPAMLAAKARGR